MGILLDLKIPGSGSVEDVLSKIEEHANEMKEVRHACMRLHGVLQAVFNEVQELESSYGQLVQNEAVGKFVAVLSKCIECFKLYQEKRLVSRLVKYQALMENLRFIYEDMDAFLVVLNMTTIAALKDWKQQWEADQRAQREVMEPIVLFNRLGDGVIRENVTNVIFSDRQGEVLVEVDSNRCISGGDQRNSSDIPDVVDSYPAGSSQVLAVSPETDTDKTIDTTVNNEPLVDEGSESLESAHEDITHLLEHVRTGNEEQKRIATEELAKFVVSHDEIRAHFVEEGILPPLVHLLRAGTDRQKAWATNALIKLAAMNDGTRAAIVREKAIPPLVSILRDGTADQKRLATSVLAHLTFSNEAVRVEIVREGVIAPLTALVQSGTDAQKQSAANVLAHLASNNPAFKADIAKQGVIAPLVGLVRTGTDGQKIWAPTL